MKHVRGQDTPVRPSTTVCPPHHSAPSEGRTTMRKTQFVYVAAALLIAGAAVTTMATGDVDATLRDIFDRSAYVSSDVVFPANTYIFSQGGIVSVGRNQFGLADDDVTIDNTLGGVFAGPSAVYEGTVVSNGKV